MLKFIIILHKLTLNTFYKCNIILIYLLNYICMINIKINILNIKTNI
jgi:hypothetical protein